jgi:hypothetical protein
MDREGHVTSHLEHWYRRRSLIALLVCAAVPRAWAAVFDQGIFWPDEIFKTLLEIESAR